MESARRCVPGAVLALVLGISSLAGCGPTEAGAQPPPAAAQQPGPGGDEHERRIERARQARDPERLRHLLSVLVLLDEVPAARRNAWTAELDRLNAAHVWDPETVGPRFETTEVRRGESYWKIVRRISRGGGPRLSPGLLERINRTPARKLRLGQVLKYPARPVGVVVSRKRFEIGLTLDGGLIARWPCAIGRDGRTPPGTYTIESKVVNPPWRDPETGRMHKFGTPGHRIGTRWIGWARDGEGTGLGIHGTDEPESIGSAASLGCVRMRQGDLEGLFELVREGMKVEVR